MQTHNLGYPRIGSRRELKKAAELYRAGKIPVNELISTGRTIRLRNWQLQQAAGIDLIPVGDFSFYDHVLDTCLMVGAIPERYHSLLAGKQLREIDLLDAMAHGYQQNGYDLTAMKMTKWFDTNYHHIVPEFSAKQHFTLYSNKLLNEFREAKEAGFNAKPVLLGPVSFLLLGKENEEGFNRLTLIKKLLPVYLEILKKLDDAGAFYVQMDEPCLSLDLTDAERKVFTDTYREINAKVPQLQIILASYFECYGENLPTVLNLPVNTIHLDLIRCSLQLDDILNTPFVRSHTRLSLGVVDGRNIWKNDYQASIHLIHKAIRKIGADRIWIAPSCSLLHSPCDLDLETNESSLPKTMKEWMAFAKQKLREVSALRKLAIGEQNAETDRVWRDNVDAMTSRRKSDLIHKPAVKASVQAITAKHDRRLHAFPERKWHQQEALGIDMIVHRESERNDVLAYFGAKLDGFVFTEHGWVQSYGTHCGKPPIIFGDVSRLQQIDVLRSAHAKRLLTSPITILQWSFVRNDQPQSETCKQIALAIHEEVVDLEAAGIHIIRIDEPAIGEGLPLRRENWQHYLDWAIRTCSMI